MIVDGGVQNAWTNFLISKFVIPQIIYSVLIKKIDRDDIFAKWIIKHGVANPFKHGAHYMN